MGDVGVAQGGAGQGQGPLPRLQCAPIRRDGAPAADEGHGQGPLEGNGAIAEVQLVQGNELLLSMEEVIKHNDLQDPCSERTRVHVIAGLLPGTRCVGIKGRVEIRGRAVAGDPIVKGLVQGGLQFGGTGTLPHHAWAVADGAAWVDCGDEVHVDLLPEAADPESCTRINELHERGGLVILQRHIDFKYARGVDDEEYIVAIQGYQVQTFRPDVPAGGLTLVRAAARQQGFLLPDHVLANVREYTIDVIEREFEAGDVFTYPVRDWVMSSAQLREMLPRHVDEIRGLEPGTSVSGDPSFVAPGLFDDGCNLILGLLGAVYNGRNVAYDTWLDERRERHMWWRSRKAWNQTHRHIGRWGPFSGPPTYEQAIQQLNDDAEWRAGHDDEGRPIELLPADGDGRDHEDRSPDGHLSDGRPFWYLGSSSEGGDSSRGELSPAFDRFDRSPPASDFGGDSDDSDDEGPEFSPPSFRISTNWHCNPDQLLSYIGTVPSAGGERWYERLPALVFGSAGQQLARGASPGIHIIF